MWVIKWLFHIMQPQHNSEPIDRPPKPIKFWIFTTVIPLRNLWTRSWIQAESISNSYSLQCQSQEVSTVVCISTSTKRERNKAWDETLCDNLQARWQEHHQITDREFDSLNWRNAWNLWEGESWPFSPKLEEWSLWTTIFNSGNSNKVVA